MSVATRNLILLANVFRISSSNVDVHPCSCAFPFHADGCIVSSSSRVQKCFAQLPQPASKSQAARAVEPQYQDPRKGAPQWLCAFQRRRTAASCTTGPNQQSTILSDQAKQHNGRDSPRALGNLTRIASVENSSRWQPSTPGLKLHRVTPMIISLRDGNRHWDWIRT
jgi:hypothetical protein